MTDAQGRIYRIDARRSASLRAEPGRADSGNGTSSTGNAQDATLIAQANESDATRLVASQRGIFAAMGSAAKLVRLDATATAGGWFESPVHDSGAVARWGRILVDRYFANQGVTFRTRTGNSARPDSTWSDWAAVTSTAPITTSAAIASPNARFIQWRAEVSRTPPPRSQASVWRTYRRTPRPPFAASACRRRSASPATKAASASSSTAYSITVTDTAATPPRPRARRPRRFRRPSGQQMQVSWQADDPDGDKLAYTLYFRGEDERDWKLLRANMSENTYPLDADALADGRYYFRVVASDRPSNAADQARQTELVSAPVLIDNTPPVVTARFTTALEYGGRYRRGYQRRCRRSRLRSSSLRILRGHAALAPGGGRRRRDRFAARTLSDPH